MTKPAAFCDLGLAEYLGVLALQRSLVALRHRKTLVTDLFLCVEHQPVYTLGRNASREHLSVSTAFLEARGIAVIPIERGGEITYHGPGQLVLYPILHLRERRLGVSEYVWLLEELMLRLALASGIQAGRDVRNHGVWVGNNKLGSIGIAIRHGIAFHGLALNVSLDLEPFSWINPCGLSQVGVTSLHREGAATLSMDAVKINLCSLLADLFQVDLSFLPSAQLADLALSGSDHGQ